MDSNPGDLQSSDASSAIKPGVGGQCPIFCGSCSEFFGEWCSNFNEFHLDAQGDIQTIIPDGLGSIYQDERGFSHHAIASLIGVCIPLETSFLRLIFPAM
jgi:hypothetical protein